MVCPSPGKYEVFRHVYWTTFYICAIPLCFDAVVVLVTDLSISYYTRGLSVSLYQFRHSFGIWRCSNGHVPVSQALVPSNLKIWIYLRTPLPRYSGRRRLEPSANSHFFAVACSWSLIVRAYVCANCQATAAVG